MSPNPDGGKGDAEPLGCYLRGHEPIRPGG